MKKMIGSLALIGLTTLAFGQDAPKAAPAWALSGYVDTGITVLANAKDNATLGAWGEDAGANGGRVKLVGKYDNSGYGINFDLRQDGFNTIPAFKSVFVYGNFFDKLVYTQVGVVKEETSRTGGDAGFSYTRETEGAVVVVKPLDGLSFNAFVAGAVATSNLVDTTTAFGAAYSLANVVKVVGQAKLSYTAAKTYAVSDFYAGAGLLSVPNLTAWLEVANTGLNNGKLEGKTTLVETVSYGFKDMGMAPLSVGVVAYQYLYGDDKKNAITGTNANKDAYGLSLKLTPWASYALDGGITPKLAVTYFSGAEVTTPAAKDRYANDLKLGIPLSYFDSSKASAANVNKQALVEIKPSVKIALTSAQSLSFVYSLITSVGEEKLTFLSGNADANSLHTFQTVYTYNF